MRFLLMILLPVGLFAQPLIINKTKDFTVNGKGDAREWTSAEWTNIPYREGNKKNYELKVKMLYSDSGVYVLFHNTDDKITSTMSKDNLDLWNEDVNEIFFWTDEKVPIYFEYEISPRNYELPILVPNNNGKFLGWLPWHYEGSRKIQHLTSIQPDNSWTAEVYIPYKVLAPLTNVPPTKGTSWRCNIYRIDHDDGATEFSWKPTKVNFHDYKLFGVVKFN